MHFGNFAKPEFTAPPTGSIIWEAASAAPSGYLKANGATLSRTVYADLFGAIGIVFGAGDGSTTFKIPDLRGDFVRGWDDGRGVDLARGLGSYQGDAFQFHAHTVVYSTTAGSQGILQGSLSASGANNASQQQYQSLTAMIGQAAPRAAQETRPRNIALLACIKF